jgi:antitoxin component of MazEF toxin-antitoxin module
MTSLSSAYEDSGLRLDESEVTICSRLIATRHSQSSARSGRPCLSLDISVYTELMKIVKVRRVGNSNVVSIPREFEASGYTPGTSVLVEELADGELRILPAERVRQRVRQIATRVVSEHPEAMDILAGYDPDDENSSH